MNFEDRSALFDMLPSLWPYLVAQRVNEFSCTMW